MVGLVGNEGLEGPLDILDEWRSYGDYLQEL